MKKIGVFPGSFDPFTKGHEAVVRKSLALFDEVIIGIGVNSTKSYLFDLDKRTEHIKSLFLDNPNVSIKHFEKLTVDFCQEVGAQFIIRGLRDSKDFQYEKPIAQLNYDMKQIDTVFFLTDARFSAISSSIIREIYKNNSSIEQFVTNPHLLV